ncbi:trimeric autotransporter adhesin [Collimonas sp. PA-H2]|uniref:ESPR-type extended signal peptide-containing protein n=1 Tax=Collimonas sp. PA-H2 TaxID=1881062 RepID=UPI000BF69BE4|nr:ESPR-type extended signal peptide-containing protein [Collimonas sp. PA-H2]PFH08834.1 trimeric autotransporter adhesin [Collimonas sp. PA-H2]
MNQSYRVVWQASTNTCCAVSELARTKGKSKSRKTGHAKMLARIVALSLGVTGAGAALANTENTEEATTGSQLQANCIAADERAQRRLNASDKNDCKDDSIKAGPSTFTTALQGSGVTSSTLDASAQARTRIAAPPNSGADATADEQSLAANSMAPGARSDAAGVDSISAGKAGNERKITNVAAGTQAADAINKAQLDALAYSVGDASHYLAVNGRGDGSDDAIAAGVNSSAFGIDAQANGNGGSLAVGAYSTAQGHFSAAVGSESYALGDFSTALGPYASALSDGTTALGAESIAFGDQSIAVGSRSAAIGTASIAMGNFAKTENTGAIAIGSQYQEAEGEIGIQEAAYANGRNAIAFGAGATAYATDSLALGPRAIVEANNSVALGDHALADRTNTVSVGNARASDGTVVQTRQIVNVAAGTEDNDAVNVGQMNSAIGEVNTSIAGALTYGDASKQKLTLAGVNGSVIDNLADGTLTAGSKQAVNGGQLFQLSDNLAQMLGGGAMMGVNGFTGPVFGVQGGSYHNVGDALGALDGALDSLGNRVSNLESGGVQAAANSPKPVAKIARDVAPPAAPAAAPGAGADTGKDIVTQDQLDEVKDYADAGNKQTLGSANQYTDRKVANMVTQSDFNDFKGSVDQRFDTVHKKISRVGAMASAMAGMAGAIAAAPPNDNRVSAALGGYGGQTALSLGYARRISNSGALLVGASVASGGESSGTVGVSFGW